MPPAPPLEDWLAAVARGDRRAFARLYAETRRPLYALLLRTLERPALAEEALQDTYIRIWLKAASFDPERSAALTWMMAIARHRALDLIRARPDEDPLPDPEDDDAERHLPRAVLVDERESPGARAEEAQALERLRRSLAHMDPAQRRVIELAYFDGYSHGELAALLKIPLGTVKVRIRRGLARLRGIVGIR